MAAATDKQRKLFNFLKENSEFVIFDIVNATGYKQSTILTYINKKLINYVVNREKVNGVMVLENS